MLTKVKKHRKQKKAKSPQMMKIDKTEDKAKKLQDLTILGKSVGYGSSTKP